MSYLLLKNGISIRRYQIKSAALKRMEFLASQEAKPTNYALVKVVSTTDVNILKSKV